MGPLLRRGAERPSPTTTPVLRGWVSGWGFAFLLPVRRVVTGRARKGRREGAGQGSKHGCQALPGARGRRPSKRQAAAIKLEPPPEGRAKRSGERKSKERPGQASHQEKLNKHVTYSLHFRFSSEIPREGRRGARRESGVSTKV